MQNNKAKIIIFGNQKGGVAKTTSTYNVGACLAKMGKKVLMIDLDPQASLTMICGFENPEMFDGKNMAALLGDNNVATKDCMIQLNFEEKYKILATDEGKQRKNVISTEKLYLIPSDLPLAKVEYDMFSRIKREEILKHKLEEVQDEFDYILIDCPPSLGLLTVNAIVASDGVIACVEPQYQAIRGLEFYKNNLAALKKDCYKQNLKYLGVIITKIPSQGKDVSDYQELIAESNNVLAKIPQAVIVYALDGYGIPVVYNKPSQQTSLGYYKVAENIISLI